jgi:hypothetical protein
MRRVEIAGSKGRKPGVARIRQSTSVGAGEHQELFLRVAGAVELRRITDLATATDGLLAEEH